MRSHRYVSSPELAPEFQRNKAHSYDYSVRFFNQNDIAVADVDFVSSDQDEAVLDLDLLWNGSTRPVTERFTLRRSGDAGFVIVSQASVRAPGSARRRGRSDAVGPARLQQAIVTFSDRFQFQLRHLSDTSTGGRVRDTAHHGESVDLNRDEGQKFADNRRCLRSISGTDVVEQEYEASLHSLEQVSQIRRKLIASRPMFQRDSRRGARRVSRCPAIAARGLGAIHRSVCVMQQSLGRQVPVSGDGETDACRDRHHDRGHLDRGIQTAEYPIGESRRQGTIAD
ncbi:MAG: hypothetical protein ABIR32_22955 [Ilumatobacteraceae bacterium]